MALVPPAVVTVISTMPALPAGDAAVICVALLTTKEAALVAPNFTAVAPLRLVPVMTTEVAPVAGPVAGAMLLMVGAAAVTVSVAAVPAVPLTEPVALGLPVGIA